MILYVARWSNSNRKVQMKPLAIIFITFIFLLPAALAAADITVTNESEAAQQEQLFQRFLKEMRKVQSEAPTNV